MYKIFMMVMIMGSVVFAGETLTIYTYDSFSWVEDELIKQFEDEYNCKINVTKFSSTGMMIARLILEKAKPRADVAIGFTPALLVKAKENELLEHYRTEKLSKIKSKELIFDSEFFVTPYDYGGIAFVYDKKKFPQGINSFEELLGLDKKLIIQDPRHSSTGQDFLLWTIAVYGDEWQNYWRKLKPAILTVAPGWTESFTKFEAGEAPIMVSYSTDGAYSYHYYNSVTYGASIPKEGGYVQLEGVGIINGTKNIKLAEKFIDFMLSDNFQKELPLNQWMFPVVDVEMPEAFKYAIQPKKINEINGRIIEKNLDRWLNEWENIMY